MSDGDASLTDDEEMSDEIGGDEASPILPLIESPSSLPFNNNIDDSLTTVNPTNPPQHGDLAMFEMPPFAHGHAANVTNLFKEDTGDDNSNSPPPFVMPSNTRLGVAISNWEMAATWQWDTGDRTDCGLCHKSFEEKAVCEQCVDPGLGDNCPLIWSTCTHVFHLHCINNWPVLPEACPVCRHVPFTF